MPIQRMTLVLIAEAEIVEGRIVANSQGTVSVTIDGSVENVARALATAMLDEYEAGHQNLCDIVTSAAHTFTQIIDEKKAGGIHQDDTRQSGAGA